MAGGLAGEIGKMTGRRPCRKSTVRYLRVYVLRESGEQECLSVAGIPVADDDEFWWWAVGSGPGGYKGGGRG